VERLKVGKKIEEKVLKVTGWRKYRKAIKVHATLKRKIAVKSTKLIALLQAARASLTSTITHVPVVTNKTIFYGRHSEHNIMKLNANVLSERSRLEQRVARSR
jgi:hypothetical protein